MGKYYLGIVGSRSRTSHDDYLIVENIVKEFGTKYGRNLVLVSGGCSKGADNFAEIVAKKEGIPILIFYPDIDNAGGYNKQLYAIACFARNTEIAERSNALLALVCEERKGGTEDTIKKFQKNRPDGVLIIR